MIEFISTLPHCFIASPQPQIRQEGHHTQSGFIPVRYLGSQRSPMGPEGTRSLLHLFLQCQSAMGLEGHLGSQVPQPFRQTKALPHGDSQSHHGDTPGR